jgi:prepilin-type processing-associated H-X9-DG protein
MNESKEKIQNAARISRPAIAAMVLGICGPLCGVAVSTAIAFVQFVLASIFIPLSCFPFDTLAIGYAASWLPAYLIGKNALNKISASGGLLGGIGYAKVGIKSAVIWAVLLPIIVIFMGILIPTFLREQQISHRMICGTNLSNLGKELTIYVEKYGAYPQPDKWCDILLQGKYVTEDIFKCPDNKKVRCSYSMNPNCDDVNSPPDVVLLFESSGGWNSFGGPELFTTKNHKENGGNVLFNDGHVAFVKTDPNGQPYEKLNWGEKAKGRDSK